MDQIENWSLTWLPILLMVALVYLVWRTLKMMPRTKPQQIKPRVLRARSSGTTSPAARRPSTSCARSSSSCASPERFKKLGATVPKGILLHGPPGTGKTLLAKAVASESGAHFFSQSASAFVEMFAGLGAARIRRLFEIAKKHAPGDHLHRRARRDRACKRGFDLSREKDQTLNQLLVEMDGFEDRGDLIVIAASNRVDGLDPALMRPGRFDRQVLVSPPDLEGREQILQVHTRNKPLERRRPRDGRAPHRPASRAPTSRTSATRRRSSPGREGARRSSRADFDGALERVVAGPSDARA